VDISVERSIDAPPGSVAAVMFDAANDPLWMGGAKTVRKLTAEPLRVGSRVRRDGGFLGRRFHWVTEVVAFEPCRRLEMAFVEGPMRGRVSYEIRPEDGRSRVVIRNHGAASFVVPGIAWMLRKSVAKDLARLSQLVLRRAQDDQGEPSP
jgi:uncharacterized protein YndB with AHSA1/START domain